MARFLVIPDSFKGTLSARQVCRVMDKAILRQFPGAEVIGIPAADGGEGTAEAFLSVLGGQSRAETVCGPLGTPVKAVYGLLSDGSAVIDMASCAGLPLAGSRKDPEKATTYGVGQLLRSALDRGAKRLLLGLGGSATNDGGCGMAAACGVQFLDGEGQAFVPTGGTLERIASIDLSRLDPRLREAELTALCDIDSPLCGPTGAAAMFSPQKGADPAMTARLEAGLQHLRAVWQAQTGQDLQEISGGGAAGGMGAGVCAFLGGRLRPGMDTLLDLADFEALARGAAMIFTGEGCLDEQSLRGKAVVALARRAKALGVPVVAVVGGVRGDMAAIYGCGITAVFPINRQPQPLCESAAHAEENLARTMDDILRLLAARGEGRKE